MKFGARLVVHCASPTVAKSLEDVLTPDNVGVPGAQRFSMSRLERSLTFVVESADLPSLTSTLNSALADAALFQEVWLLSRRG